MTEIGSTRPAWLPFEEFPFESRFLELDGHRIHFLDEGSGPTLLLLHAGPAWSFVYRDLMLALKPYFRLVTLDLPGSGLSEAAPGYRPGLAAASEVVGRFLDHLALDDVVLVAHDVGGPVALHAAATRAERLRGIVLNGSFGWSLTRHQPQVARFLRLMGSPPFRALDAATGLLARASSGTGGVGRRLSPAGRRAFRGPFRRAGARRTATAMLGAAAREDAFLDEVEAAVRGPLRHLPVLLSYGEHDPGRRAGFQQHFLDLFADATPEVIAGARHFPQADAPHQVAASLRRWWEGTRAQPAA
jgi:haloalkane dehalogenase